MKKEATGENYRPHVMGLSIVLLFLLIVLAFTFFNSADTVNSITGFAEATPSATPTPGGTPSEPKYKEFDGNLPLIWNPSPDPRTKGYVLVYGTKSGVYDKSIDVGNSAEYTVTGLEGNKQYFFAVYAYGGTNNQLKSDLSNELSYFIPAKQEIRRSTTIELKWIKPPTTDILIEQSTNLVDWTAVSLKPSDIKRVRLPSNFIDMTITLTSSNQNLFYRISSTTFSSPPLKISPPSP